MHRLGVPRRIVSIVEGESLVNDGTALVAYRFAVVATVSGAFSLWDAGISFVLNVLGGVAVGLAVGWIVRQVRRRLDFPPAEVTISLLTGYFAYIPAELIGVSAVIAAVTVGIYMGWYTPELTTPEVRLMGESAWEIVTFTLNAILFTLIGLQLPGILDELDAYSADRPALVGGGHLAHGARRPRPLGLPGGQAAAAADPDGPRTRPDAASIGAGADHVVRDARRRLARGGAGDPAHHRRRRALPRPRPDPLPHVRRHLRHPRRPGPDAAGRDPPPPPRGRRRGRCARAGAGPDPRGERRPAAARRARRGGLGARRHRRAGPRRLRLQAQPLLGLARRRRRRLDRGALARLPAAPARAPERRARGRARAAAERARSRTRWPAGSSATSTSRTPGSRSDEPPPRSASATCASAAAAASSCPGSPARSRRGR